MQKHSDSICLSNNGMVRLLVLRLSLGMKGFLPEDGEGVRICLGKVAQLPASRLAFFPQNQSQGQAAHHNASTSVKGEVVSRGTYPACI